jgi:hypothetical protein
MLLKIQIFWDFTLCRLVNNYRLFEGSYCVLLRYLGLLDSEYKVLLCNDTAVTT